MVDEFFIALKQAIEDTPSLKRGAAFLPDYLPGKKLTGMRFRPVVQKLRRSLGVTVGEQFHNPFPPEYGTGFKSQRVDYVLCKGGTPQIFLELESLDRAQVSTFRDPAGKLEKHSLNKLWYYYVTLGERHRGKLPGPRVFAFLLILPDEPVGYYQNWDCSKDYSFFKPSLAPRIRQNPFRFYDHRIKACARRFLQTRQQFPVPPGLESWTWKTPKQLEHLSELVLFTATRKELIMSRGRHLFAKDKEVRQPFRWRLG